MKLPLGYFGVARTRIDAGQMDGGQRGARAQGRSKDLGIRGFISRHLDGRVVRKSLVTARVMSCLDLWVGTGLGSWVALLGLVVRLLPSLETVEVFDFGVFCCEPSDWRGLILGLDRLLRDLLTCLGIFLRHGSRDTTPLQQAALFTMSLATRLASHQHLGDQLVR